MAVMRIGFGALRWKEWGRDANWNDFFIRRTVRSRTVRADARVK
jgi:hypothetical protein